MLPTGRGGRDRALRSRGLEQAGPDWTRPDTADRCIGWEEKKRTSPSLCKQPLELSSEGCELKLTGCGRSAERGMLFWKDDPRAAAV